jgi:copper resistance protein B
MTFGSRAAVFVVVAVLLQGAAAPAAEPASASGGVARAQGHAGHGGEQDKPKAPPAGADHSGHGQGGQEKPKPVPAGEDHLHHDHGGQEPLPPGIPPLTDDDRAAAFPELHGQHTVHDQAVHSFVLFDRFEWQRGGGENAFSWNTKGWIGRDIDRFWFRTEGEGEHGRLESGEAHLLYGRAIARWWDLVAGVRQDVRPGPAQTWAAFGIQGLAPYWFEVEATAYVSTGGQTHVRLETEYELLFTNRLILQPLLEVQIHGRSDRERGIGAGLSSGEAGLRLRYEIRREFAPYVGVSWERKFLGTADLAREAGSATRSARLALGLRLWF